MGLRWYSTVVDAHDHRKLAAWWAETLDWRVVFEDENEAAVIPKWLDEENPGVPFDRVGPGLVFVPVSDAKAGKNRLHIDLAAPLHESQTAHVDALLGGARLGRMLARATTLRGSSCATLKAMSFACSPRGRAELRRGAPRPSRECRWSGPRSRHDRSANRRRSRVHRSVPGGGTLGAEGRRVPALLRRRPARRVRLRRNPPVLAALPGASCPACNGVAPTPWPERCVLRLRDLPQRFRRVWR